MQQRLIVLWVFLFPGKAVRLLGTDIKVKEELPRDIVGIFNVRSAQLSCLRGHDGLKYFLLLAQQSRGKGCLAVPVNEEAAREHIHPAEVKIAVSFLCRPRRQRVHAFHKLLHALDESTPQPALPRLIAVIVVHGRTS